MASRRPTHQHCRYATQCDPGPVDETPHYAIEDEDGTVVDIPDQRPQVQRLHDALEEACARLLKSADQPSVGGVPASVVVTIGIDDLLAKTGLADTADGSQLTLINSSGSRMRPRSGPPSSTETVSRWP